jgi:hypothetical protein
MAEGHASMPDLQCVLSQLASMRQSMDDKIDRFQERFTEISTEWIGICKVGNHRISELEGWQKQHIKEFKELSKRVDTLEHGRSIGETQVDLIAKFGKLAWGFLFAFSVALWEGGKTLYELLAPSLFHR